MYYFLYWRSHLSSPLESQALLSFAQLFDRYETSNMAGLVDNESLTLVHLLHLYEQKCHQN